MLATARQFIAARDDRVVLDSRGHVDKHLGNGIGVKRAAISTLANADISKLALQSFVEAI